MSGKIIINVVKDCENVEITMKDGTVSADCESMEVNNVSNCKNTKISMQNLKVSKRGTPSRHQSGPAGDLTLNRITDSRQTDINQDGMSLRGKFHNVTLNDVKNSSGTSVSIKGAKFDIEGDSDSSGGNSDSEVLQCGEDKKTTKQDILDEYGLPKPSTRAYYLAPKYTVRICRKNAGNIIRCSFLQQDPIERVINFITNAEPGLKNRIINLQDVKTHVYVGGNTKATLTEAGFYDGIEICTVEVDEQEVTEVAV